MLANFQDTNPQSGLLKKDVHLPATSRYALIEFITGELPRWRDRSDRKAEKAETILTSHLCAHLNSVARHSTWDFIQFRVEEPDEKHKGRKLDLVAAPCGVPVLIEGRSYTDFEPILPIECKRLPTPTDKNRDEREYVFSRHSSTGGIQRFKAGHHGATHSLAAMIAYVQEETLVFWSKQVSKWVKGLVSANEQGWSNEDVLHPISKDEKKQICVLRSSHIRSDKQGQIELQHLWVNMQ